MTDRLPTTRWRFRFTGPTGDYSLVLEGDLDAKPEAASYARRMAAHHFGPDWVQAAALEIEDLGPDPQKLAAGPEQGFQVQDWKA